MNRLPYWRMSTPRKWCSTRIGTHFYFSRSIIPFQRNADKEDWLKGHTYYKHIGLYAYRTEVLKEITALPQSSLELAESLEQLRWLENGYKIKVGISDVETIGIDTAGSETCRRIFEEQKLIYGSYDTT